MIALPSLFLFLAILPYSKQSATVFSRRSLVDWTKCGKFAQCFCVKDPSNPVLDHQQSSVPAPVNEPRTPEEDEGICNIGIYSKYMTGETALFQMQIIDDAIKSDAQLKLMLYHDDKEIFGCQFDNKKQKKVEALNNLAISTCKISAFEGRSRLEDGHVICAIRVERADKLRAWLVEESITFKITMMRLTTTKDVDYSRPNSGDNFFAPTDIQCNPYSFNDNSNSKHDETVTQYLVLPLINKDKDVISCEESYGPYYTMRYENSATGAIPMEAEKLECTRDPNNPSKYYYNIVTNETDAATNSPIVVPINEPGSFNIYCAAEYKVLCENPAKGCTEAKNGLLCPTYTNGTKGSAATLTCPGKKWFIDGEYINSTDPECKKDYIGNTNAAYFFMTLPSETEEKMPEAKCFTEYDCRKKSKLEYAGCSEGEECEKLDFSGGVMSCKDKEKTMEVVELEKNITMTSTNYTCNTTTGEWINEKDGVSIPPHAQVRCKSPAPPVAQLKASLDQQQVIMIIAGSTAAIILLIVAVVALVIFCYSRKNSVGVKGNKAWLKLKSAERIQNCKEGFGEILMATPASAYNITNGLSLIHLLLETETEEPECWDEANRFLMRFQGAIMRLDQNIWQMFNRYMYLQAKKIIDKHGWLTPDKIRKGNTKGLIRVVAIRLLSFSLFDPTYSDSEKLLKEGFKKLAFRATTQYPHCGVMWSVILHARPPANKRTTDSTIKSFDRLKFMQNMKAVAFDAKIAMPKEETIPAFGSITYQAGYALGSTTYPIFHRGPKLPTNQDPFTLAMKLILQKENNEDGQASKGYFEGILGALTRDPLQTVFEFLNMWDGYNQKFMDAFKLVVPEGEIASAVQETFKMLTYYGRYLDVKRLQTRFIPKEEVDIATMQMDQQLFEDAVDKKKEELREWFAERTDKEELKKKQEYVMSGKVKLDYRIIGDNPKNVLGGTVSNSDNRSDSDSRMDVRPKSDSKSSEKSPAPAAAASPTAEKPAAPVAAATPAKP